MVTVTVTGSIKEVLEELAQFGTGTVYVEGAKAPKAAKPAKADLPPHVESAVHTMPVRLPDAPTAAPAPTLAPAPAPAGLTANDITVLINATVKRLGKKEQVVALLAEFGATRGSELKPAQYENFAARTAALV